MTQKCVPNIWCIYPNAFFSRSSLSLSSNLTKTNGLSIWWEREISFTSITYQLIPTDWSLLLLMENRFSTFSYTLFPSPITIFSLLVCSSGVSSTYFHRKMFLLFTYSTQQQYNGEMVSGKSFRVTLCRKNPSIMLTWKSSFFFLFTI